MSENIETIIEFITKAIAYISSLGGTGMLIYGIIIGRLSRILMKVVSTLLIIGGIFMLISYWDVIYPYIQPYIPSQLQQIITEIIARFA